MRKARVQLNAGESALGPFDGISSELVKKMIQTSVTTRATFKYAINNY